MNNVSPSHHPVHLLETYRAVLLAAARARGGVSEKASLHDNLIGHGDNLIALSLCCRPTTAR